MNYFGNAIPGLRKMGYMQIGVLVCGVLGIIPAINVVVAIAGFVLSILYLIGLYQAGKDINGCSNAFYASIMVIACGFLIRITTYIPVVSLIFSLIVFGLNIWICYSICASVGEVFEMKGQNDLAKLGNTVWFIFLICSVCSILLSIVFKFIPLGFSRISNIVLTIFSIIQSIVYAIFLIKSADGLET